MPNSSLFLFPADDDDTAIVGPPAQNNIMAWLDAGYRVYQQNTGEIPATTRAGFWTDRSGNGNHFSVAGDSRPIFTPSDVNMNGRSSVQFPVEPVGGVNTTFLNNATIDFAGQWTLAMATYWVRRLYVRDIFLDANGKGLFADAAGNLVFTDGTNQVVSSNIPDDNDQVVIIARSGPTAILDINLVQTTGTHTNLVPWTATVVLGQDDPANPVDITVGELFLWNKYLTDEETENLLLYWKGKFDA